jgi:ATP-dependent Clp protease ATP-binding subunit ClpC
MQQNSKTINSGHVLLSIINNNSEINRYFRSFGVTPSQVNTQVIEETNAMNDEERQRNEENFISTPPQKHNKKPKKEEPKTHTLVIGEGNDVILAALTQQMGVRTNVVGECERTFTNLNEKASHMQIDTIYGNEKVYDEIFNVLSKRNKNNVIITGKSGVGKSDTVRNLANMIVNKQVPKPFLDKVLLEVDFNMLMSNTGMRGAFEAKMKMILEDAKQKGNYIFFMDSVSNALGSKFNENNIDEFVECVLKEKSIMLICTCSEKGYIKEIGDYPEWERFFEKITMEEPNDEDCKEILNQHARKLEYFHNVRYDDDSIDTCMKYCRRYIPERCLPDSAIDILDKVGAKMGLLETENENIKITRQKLIEIRKEKEELRNSTKDYKKLDDLIREEINLQSILDFAIKSHNLEKQPFLITGNDIKKAISEKTNIPVDDLNDDDKGKLKNLNERIKKIVIGQDDAVDTVCKAIKRQRIGISNPNKPVVFLMAGSTGVGKSYLAKMIAKEMFGNENKLIRVDCTEYSDSTSVNKIIGASPGYIGYDKHNGITEQIKKNKHCVLLLDEVEKAHENVHNVFLTLFDEGRLTDNKGITVDFKNVIIVMTSNIGAREADERGNGIGFASFNENDLKKEIIEKELKRKFKPEFINRIDKIVYFNKLTDENIKFIIGLEIDKVRKRLEDMGYGLVGNEQLPNLIDNIYNKVREMKNMGARPIIREIQIQLEDKITDYVIDNNVEKGYTFDENVLL